MEVQHLFDIGNSLFEFVGALINWINVRRLYLDKEAKGVSWTAFAFFGSWGLWNMFYYPVLGQWLSFSAGFFIVSANLTWVVLYFYYANNQRT